MHWAFLACFSACNISLTDLTCSAVLRFPRNSNAKLQDANEQLEDIDDHCLTTLKGGGIMDVKEYYPWGPGRSCGPMVANKRHDKRRGHTTGQVDHAKGHPCIMWALILLFINLLIRQSRSHPNLLRQPYWAALLQFKARGQHSLVSRGCSQSADSHGTNRCLAVGVTDLS